jgi:Zn-dependent alcohol dehydrogenase
VSIFVNHYPRGPAIDPLQLGVVTTSALVGASRIIAVDTNPNKEAWAKKFGATDFVNPAQLKEGMKIQDFLVEMTDGGWAFLLLSLNYSLIFFSGWITLSTVPAM